jgi:8-oxo-dGTP pyrophosphatase MutT (NUDIX family)
MSGEQIRGRQGSEPMTARVSQKAVVFDPGGEILLLRDAKCGDWEFPGGRIDRGERPIEALNREIREETDLSVAVERPVFTDTKRRTKKRAKFFVYYRCSVPERRPTVTISDEHTDYRWVDPAAVPELNRRRRTALGLALEEGDWER